MKLWLVGAWVLFVTLPVALGLKCYFCASATSWADCETHSVDCPPSHDRCSKVYMKFGSTKIFTKYCVNSLGCFQNGNPTCKGKSGSFECDISCCEGDYCNAGSTSGISGILLTICALASLMIFVKA